MGLKSQVPNEAKNEAKTRPERGQKIALEAFQLKKQRAIKQYKESRGESRRERERERGEREREIERERREQERGGERESESEGAKEGRMEGSCCCRNKHM